MGHLIILKIKNFFSLLQSVYTDKTPDSSILPLEHRGVDINPIPLGAASTNNKRQIPIPPNYIPSGPGLLQPPNGGGLASYPPQGSPIGPTAEDQWPIGQPSDQPQIKNLQVQCEKTHMRVNIEFDRPFYGMIFSKGHYSDSNCVHVRPGSGQLSATFDVYLNTCGMTSSANQVDIHWQRVSKYVRNIHLKTLFRVSYTGCWRWIWSSFTCRNFC